MSSRRYFGTDGIRGRVGQFPMTPDFVLKLGLATGAVLNQLANKKGRVPRVVMGRDTRMSGKMLEAGLEAGLSASGIDVFLLGYMPTPGVAYLTRTFQADAGIVISASHNPFEDNGIKFFGPDGRKLSDALESEIEQLCEASIPMVGPEYIGCVTSVTDASGRYIEFCKSSVSPFFSLGGLKIVIDAAQGAAFQILPAVFRELGAQVIELSCQPTGFNINHACGATDTKALQEAVVAHHAHIGVALDGDGDRVILVDHLGQQVDGDEILYILALDAKRKGHLGQGGVVGTLMSNLALEQALHAERIPFARTKVGDRYVMQALHERGWYLGGESSGHIIWLSSTTTGDGIIAALQVLQVMQTQGVSLRALLLDYHKCPQVMINVRHTLSTLENSILEYLQELQHKVSIELGDRGRVLIRPSGTEPLVRVMVEAFDAHLAEETARHTAWKVEVFLQQS